jgi:hypothetical protein
MILTTLFAALALTNPQGSTAPVPLLDHKQLRIATSRLATEHPDLLTVLPLGESREGRPIEALRLASGELTPGRPAILLVANVDGPWAWTSGVALHHARKLATGFADDVVIRNLLSSATLYIVPRANPDGAEARFEEPLAERHATGHGIDNDRDGRQGEDPPDDVDGDGRITWMRVPDPEGTWIPDPTDPRAQVEADRDKGQSGLWKIVREGRDADDDERIAEDGERDAVVNRNFPHLWKEHHADAGLFPTDEPEVLALADFVLAHPDIALVVTYGALDNLVDAPKPIKDDARAVKRVPASGVRQSDADALAELGERYKELTGSKAKGSGARDGSFQAWCYADRGLWTIDLALWSVPLDTPAPDVDGAEEADDAEDDSEEEAEAEPKGKGKGKKDPKPSEDAKRLRWIDASEDADRFMPWSSFEHPDLGPVEIGGFAPYATIEPPTDALEELAAKEFEFLVSLGEALPRVRVVDCTYKELHENVYEVTASIESGGLLPVVSRAGRLAREPRPIRVVLELPAGAQLFAGERESLVRELSGDARRVELRWLVAGTDADGLDPTAIQVVADTDHAGVARVAPEATR